MNAPVRLPDPCLRCGKDRWTQQPSGGWAEVCWPCAEVVEAERFCVDCGKTVPTTEHYVHGRCLDDYIDWSDEINADAWDDPGTGFGGLWSEVT